MLALATLCLLPAGQIESTETLRIEAGQTLFIEDGVSLDQDAFDGIPKDVRGPAGVSLAPWIEVVAHEDGRATIIYAIEAAPSRRPGTEILEATLVLRDRSGTPIGEKSIAHELQIRSPTVKLDEIEIARDACLDHQARAAEAFARLSPLHDYLRPDRFVRPPPTTRVPKDRLDAYRTFMHHRLRADAARRRIRTAADLKEETLEIAAIQAIGALSKGPTGPAKMARAIEGLGIEAALEKAAASLTDLRLDEAEGFLDKIRSTGRLEKPELARVLQMYGAIRYARGKEDAGRVLFGQALCADPQLEPQLDRAPFLKALEAAKAAGTCETPTRIQEVKVERDQTPKLGLVYRITARYGPDPFGLVQAADLQIWGSGGGMFDERQVEATRGLEETFLVAEIPDTGNMETYAGQILVKVLLRDVSGVVIDSLGDPDPVPLSIEKGENLSTVSIPWWVWAIAGSVALAGAATATALLVTRNDGEPPLGIGPTDVTF